jgi:hypothetical protein
MNSARQVRSAAFVLSCFAVRVLDSFFMAYSK